MANGLAGTHCVLELFDCPPELLNDLDFICEAIKQASREANSTLLNLVSHQFTPQGVTAIGLLAESHLSIHTWPEHGYAAVDVFSCGDHSTPERACAFLVRKFKAKRHQMLKIPRGAKTISLDVYRSARIPRHREKDKVLCQAPA